MSLKKPFDTEDAGAFADELDCVLTEELDKLADEAGNLADDEEGKTFFPVFTSEEEMGEYGEHVSMVQEHFLQAATLAKNNEQNVKGILVNPFTEPFLVPKELFSVIAKMESSIEGGEEK